MGRLTYGHKKIEAPNRDWNGCLLVNPLCPDDLCWLPVGEGGEQHNAHCLGTMPWDARLKIGPKDLLYMSETATTAQDLYNEGASKQWDHFGDGVHPKPAGHRKPRSDKGVPRGPRRQA